MYQSINSVQESTLQTNIVRVSEDFLYDKTYVLGKGKTSNVYKGYNVKISKIVACKVIQPSQFKSQQSRRRIQRQIFILTKLSQNPHENIMQYYGHQKIKEGLCLVVEFCEGGELTQFLKSKKISQKNGLLLIYQIISGFDHFHNHIGKNQMIHRDIKPDNIFLTDQMTIKIGDFGLARESSNINQTPFLGTPSYAAPEIDGKNQNYSPACDVWSIGLIVYQILTGKRLFNSIQQQKSFVKNGLKFSLSSKFHTFWTYFLGKMLVQNPEQRSSLSKLKQILETNMEKLQKDIDKKYGYFSSKSSMKVSNNNSGSSLLSSINPKSIRSSLRQSKHFLDSIIIANREDHSFSRLNRCRKYLYYNLEVGQMYCAIIKIFNQNETFHWGNIRKYMLMALGIAAYVSRLSKILQQIRKKQIITHVFGKISKENLLEEHIPSFQLTLKSFEEDYSHLSDKYMRILTRQIFRKIEQYQMREQQAAILNYHINFSQLIANIQSDVWEQESAYITQYRRLINRAPIFIQNHIISQFNQQHVRQYYRIRLVGYSLIIFPQVYCNNEDYIIIKKQEIENSSKKELLMLIQATYDGFQ